MNINPIYLIDDDEDDHLFLQMAVDDLKLDNEVIFFKNGYDFITSLKNSPLVPFIILCDVNIHPTDGFDIREKILQDKMISYKSVPFIFWSNQVSETQIQKAYDLSVHGFFKKGDSVDEMKRFIKNIIDYWQGSIVPKEV